MNPDFWLERWHDGRTHFHQDKVSPLLQKYWPTLSLPLGSRVLVPLCGKSLDMVWLAGQGHAVLGVELSRVAIDQFFDENQMQATVHESTMGTHHIAENIEIICGDIFDIEAGTLAQCLGVYDRAALVALPPAMRHGYVTHVYGQLPDPYRGLLLALDYPQSEMDGPPFSVENAEIQSLYKDHTNAQLIDRRGILDKEPKFAERGLTRLDTVVYRLSRNRTPGAI